MSDQPSATPEFKSWDIAMIDIVGYSTLSEEGQLEAIKRLTKIVKESSVGITTSSLTTR